jgi:hypothetical protein
MKTFTAIMLLATVFFFKSTSSAADALRVSPSPLELVLIEGQVQLYSWSITNASVDIIFRNVGENWMRPNDLSLGLAIVWDGKEYKPAHPDHFFMWDGPPFAPKTGWRRSFLISDFVIPPESLASGRHTIAVRDEFSETNTFTFSPPHEAVFSKSDKQIFAESGTLTVFIKPPN